jgi:hypothetical protein
MSPAQVENVRDGAVENLRGEAQGIGPAPDALGVDDDVRAAMERRKSPEVDTKPGTVSKMTAAGRLL